MENKTNATRVVSGETLAEAYHKALKTLNDNGKIIPCQAYSTDNIEKVQKEIRLVMDVSDVNKEPFISKFMLAGPEALQDYELEFLYGVRDFCVEAYEKGLEPNFWPYTYSQRISENDQIDWLIDELIFDKETRRAVVLIRDKEVDMKVKDPACLQEFFLQIRDDKLNMQTTMRSNDATQASAMNMYVFIEFQKQITEMIKARALEYIDIFKMLSKTASKEERLNYKKMIKYLETFEKLEAKEYTHIAMSYHAYGEVVSRDEYIKYLDENEGITLREDEERKTAIHYNDGYVIGEIRRLQHNVKRIENSPLTDLVYPYDPENGYGWKQDMDKRIPPYLAELVIASSLKYGLFDDSLARKIQDVLYDYGITEAELNKACQNIGIDLSEEDNKINFSCDQSKNKTFSKKKIISR